MSDLSRRAFLERLATVGAGAAASGLLAGCDGCEEGAAVPAAPPAASAPPSAPPFPLSAVRGSREELDVELHVLAGRVPRDLEGAHFLVTPVPYGDGSHVFMGDGMTLRTTFGDGAPRLVSKIHRTACLALEEAAEGTPHAFHNAGFVRVSRTLGFRNQINTAYAHLGSSLIVAQDAGRPYVIDPVSLDIVTPLGALSEWRSALDVSGHVLPLQLTSAHPFEDPHTGEVFTVDYSTREPGHLDLVRIGIDGAISRHAVKRPDGTNAAVRQCMHQLVATETHVVLADLAFLAEPELTSGVDVSRPQAATTTLFLIDRAELRPGASVTAQVVELPVEAIHIAADYESPHGNITLHLAHIPGLDVSEAVRANDVRAIDGARVNPDLAGFLTCAGDVSAVKRFVIEAPAGRVSSGNAYSNTRHTWGLSLYTHRSALAQGGLRPPARFETMFWTAVGFHPDLYTRRIADLYADREHRVPRDELPREGVPGELLAFDVREMEIVDGYTYPNGWAIMSPQFVPRPGRPRAGGSRDGYIVTVAVSDERRERTSGDELWIFDARDLARGPVCRLGHPRLDLARTLHTTWLREPTPPPASLRRISLEEDLRERLTAASPEARAFAESALGLTTA